MASSWRKTEELSFPQNLPIKSYGPILTVRVSQTFAQGEATEAKVYLYTMLGNNRRIPKDP